MNAPYKPDPELERRLSGRLLDVLIRAGLVFALAALCYRIFSPFLSLMVWALILAVALFPIHQMVVRKLGGKQGLAATLLVLAGIVLIVFPTVVFGGVSVLTLLVHDPTYADNALRQDLWRAGHAHAGVLLLLTLVVLRYVDETGLSEGIRWYVRLAVPAAAVLLPIAFFLSVLSPDATQPTPLVYLAYVGAALLVTGLLILGIGLLRAQGQVVDGGGERRAVAAEGR